MRLLVKFYIMPYYVFIFGNWKIISFPWQLNSYLCVNMSLQFVHINLYEKQNNAYFVLPSRFIRILVNHSLGIIQFGCRQCFRTIEKLHFVPDLYKHILCWNKILKRYNISYSLWYILYTFMLSSRILFQYCRKKHDTHVWLHVSPRLPVWLSVSCDNASPLVVSLVDCYFWSRMS